MTATTSADVDAIAAKQAITEVLFGYCRAMDRMDRELALATWHADGTADYDGMFVGTGPGFVDWVWAAHEGMARHSHQITNVLVEVDGDRAVSEAYVTVALWTAGESPVEMVGRGRYLDRWSRRDGRWAVDHRRFVQDLFTTQALPADAFQGVSPLSRRDRSDPSYELFPG